MEFRRSYNEPLKSDGKRVQGYCVLFDTPTVLTEPVIYRGKVQTRTFTEIIRKCAVNRLLEGKRTCRFIANHDDSMTPISVYTRKANKNGKLILEAHDKGLWIDSPIEHCPDIVRAIEDDCLSEFSFQGNANPKGERWNANGTVLERLDIPFDHITLVAQGQYDTQAFLRNLANGYEKRKRDLDLLKMKSQS